MTTAKNVTVTPLNDGPTRLYNGGVADGKPKRLVVDIEHTARGYGFKTLTAAMIDADGKLILEGVA